MNGLPALALALVGGVLAVQLVAGGGSFEPMRSADPCAHRTVTSQADGIDGLTDRQLWEVQLKLTNVSAGMCAKLLSGTVGSPPGGSARFLRTLADLDRNDADRIQVIIDALPSRDGS